MYGANRKLSLPSQPVCRYENNAIEEYEEDGSDLYEAPPCDLQSRTAPSMWTPQNNQSVYLDRSAGGPSRPRPPLPDRFQQSHQQQKGPMKKARPPPPHKCAVPLPLPDRRMSLPCTAISSPPPTFTNFSRGMDGYEEKSKQRSENTGLENKPWYGGEMERREAEWALRRINKDGCFLVRHSSTQNQLHSYTLAVLYNDHIYNIPIRTAGTLGFSLGKEGKRNEKVFPSVVHLIEHYQHEQLNLVNRQTSEREFTALLYPALL